MKKGTKLGVFVILGLILSVSLVSIVSAEFTGIDLSKLTMGDSFSNWMKGTTDVGFAKILVFFLITLIVFLIVENILGDKYRWVNVSIAVIIGILSTAFIVPQEIQTLMLSYSALGLTITTLIPLALLLGLTYQAAKGKGNIGLILMQKWAWYIYTLFLAYKLARAASDTTVYYSGGIGIILVAVLLISAWMAIFNNSVFRLFTKNILTAERDNAKKTLARSTAYIRETAGAQQAISDDSDNMVVS
jgi:hypothetical protein